MTNIATNDVYLKAGYENKLNLFKNRRIYVFLLLITYTIM